MQIVSDWNAYWLPSGTPTRLSRWARWPEPLAVSATLDAHRSVTGQDRNSVLATGATNPYARSMSSYDLRAPSGLTLGAPATATVAAALGVAAGPVSRSAPAASWSRAARPAPSRPRRLPRRRGPCRRR